MKKLLFLSLTILLCYLGLIPDAAYALEDPLSVPNNKIGIHILFDNELKEAAKLVNSNNGDWGYVTIAIQSGDRDLEKWQAFMNSAKQNHVIPLIRLATEGDYFNTAVWRKPTDTDIVDFANFLNSLDWPVKNRYVLVFNEVNRGNEWGGNANPREYAELLSFAVTVFKSKSPDFFIIPAGLDNAAPNEGSAYINQYEFMREMNIAVPGIFNQIDGINSHSYPNPGFATPPGISCPTCINSFRYEQALVKTMTIKNLPIFLTETGWSTDKLTDRVAAGYYLAALSTVWNDPNIVAITPFLLQGSSSPFQMFSFLSATGNFTEQYNAWKNVPKIKGKPTFPNVVLSAKTSSTISQEDPVIDYSKKSIKTTQIAPSKGLKAVFKWLLKLD